jgi:hypothetical protein
MLPAEAGEALDAWCSGRTWMVGRGLSRKGNIVLSRRRSGRRSGNGTQIPEFEAVAMKLIIALN